MPNPSLASIPERAALLLIRTYEQQSVNPRRWHSMRFAVADAVATEFGCYVCAHTRSATVIVGVEDAINALHHQLGECALRPVTPGQSLVPLVLPAEKSHEMALKILRARAGMGHTDTPQWRPGQLVTGQQIAEPFGEALTAHGIPYRCQRAIGGPWPSFVFTICDADNATWYEARWVLASVHVATPSRVPVATQRKCPPQGNRHRTELLARYPWCLRCGALYGLTVDHVIPISHGGPDTLDNTQTLCARCNVWKNARWDDFRPPNGVELPQELHAMRSIRYTPLARIVAYRGWLGLPVDMSVFPAPEEGKEVGEAEVVDEEALWIEAQRRRDLIEEFNQMPVMRAKRRR